MIREEGKSSAVVKSYLGEAVSSVSTERVWNNPNTAPGNEKVRLLRASVRPTDDFVTEGITIRTPLRLEFEYLNLEPRAPLSLSLHLFNAQGNLVFATMPLSERTWHGKPFPAGLFRSVCHVPGDLLNNGVHRVLLLMVRSEDQVIFSVKDALVFDVHDAPERRGNWHGKWPGVVRPELDWTTEYLGENNGTGAAVTPQ